MNSNPPLTLALACPVPISRHAEITIGHGGGGRLTQDLIERIFRPTYGSGPLEAQHDGAVLNLGGGRLAFTTDSHVVHPLFFPGGDIGSLAINGTVNDLLMCGAKPLWISTAFILEEGLPISTLERVAASIRDAAAAAGVAVVTGDTKVVERGKGDGIYITTAGVGRIDSELAVVPASIRPGDAILVSGDVGRHGIAIMATREGLEFECAVESDCANLVAPVQALLSAGLSIHCLRDLTRGGLATALVELAESGGLDFAIDEAAVPVGESVRGACEILGLEPMYVANEGRFICILPESEAAQALAILQANALGEPPAIIGRVTAGTSRLVRLRSLIGAERILDRLSGEQLPRIC